LTYLGDMETAPTEVPERLRLGNQLCFSLYAASRAIIRAYRPLLEPYGLTYLQYLVLLILWEADGQSVNEIGHRLYLDSGTLTPLLKRMEQSQFIVRHRADDDERRVLIHLGPRGEAFRTEALRIPDTLRQTSRLDQAESRQAKLLVDQVLARMVDGGCTGSDDHGSH